MTNAVNTQQAPTTPWLTDPAPGALLTSDIPATGGAIKRCAEDFLVEEIPSYEPHGEGEHLYLFIEKRDLTTTQAVGIVARRFGVRRGAVGYAGMKDKRAITRQWLSVHIPGHDASTPTEVHDERLTTLRSGWHTNKLRVGHLAGNRFTIEIRGCDPARAAEAQRTLDTLAATGFANRAGEQRFGSTARNHLLGRADLLSDARLMLDLLLGPTHEPGRADEQARQRYAEGDHDGAFALFPRTARSERQALRSLREGGGPEDAVRAIDMTQRRFWVTAFQSAVFNRILDQRIGEGRLATLREGDLAMKQRNGAVFTVDAQTIADPDTHTRLAQLRISPTGPIWGTAMTEAQGATGEAERAALEETGVTIEYLAQFERRTRQPIAGARRALRAPMLVDREPPRAEAFTDGRGPGVRCVFALPRGAFATEVMREVMGDASTGANDHGVDDDA
ncbi:MAG: tRNA pseudouridine(13) synthase TruD [Phycisphaeraceae bacterium]|nr:tRNA pseudouridine(13) synthase TruD [Phycisphaeraceae bacterium]